MFFFKLLVLSLFSLTLYAQDTYIDSISYSKIKKLVNKEEQIAYALKKYISQKAQIPTLQNLIDNGYLPAGFSKYSPFGNEMKILTAGNKIEDVLPSDIKVKANIIDYYYSNEFRKYTQAPLSLENNFTNIVFSSNERYIIKFIDLITTDKTLALNKYYLDSNGILHWYDNSNDYKYTFGKDLIIDASVDLFDSGELSTEFLNLVKDKDVLMAGQTVFYLDFTTAHEYLNLGEVGGFIKVGDNSRDIGKTMLQFTRRSGGIIVNGDIYTWGNNANNIVAIGKNTYKNVNGVEGIGKPIVTTLVRAKAKVYDDDPLDGKDYTKISSQNYFSSPLRPKFIDFTSDVWHSTCGISTKGELYCAGHNALQSSYIDFTDYNRATQVDKEILHRSVFFDGSVGKQAKKLFPLEETWLVLSEDGKIYYWGSNHRKGWSGTGTRGQTNIRVPTDIGTFDTSIKIKDLTFALTVGFRRIAALTEDGDVYTWGLDTQSTDSINNCTQSVGGQDINLCQPLKVVSGVKFESILGGQQTFVTKDEVGAYYRISQPKGELPKVDKIDDLLASDYTDIYNEDKTILSVDISSKLIDGIIKEYESYGQGIVWVNGKNQLKGDYFTGENKDDALFQAAIEKIKWKKIRVVEDKNGMCGIDIFNQMYCWGAMSFYAGSNNAGNTFMLPIFNANLHDLDKDYLLAAGGKADGISNNVTNMTSGEWSRGAKGEYFMKYPTYIGGFNYEFTFK